MNDRLVVLEGVRNCRDLGGYAGEDGRKLGYGRIFRSASLYNATSSDMDILLGQLQIKHIIDFRNASETIVEKEPERLVQESDYHWIPILVEGTARDEIVRHLKQEHPESEDFVKLLVDVNRRLVTDHQDELREWFSILLREEPPFLFHCTEGKDRTGFAAALLLGALGVGQEDIFNDYLLTNIVNAESIEERVRNSRALSLFRLGTEQLRQLLMAQKEYLQAAFIELELHYGDLETYLHRALGVDAHAREQLRDKFLE